MFNILPALCLFYLLSELLKGVSFKEIKNLILKFFSMGVIAGILYAVSLPLSMHFHGITFNGYRGMNPDSLQSRLLSVTGLKDALKLTYLNFFRGFWGNVYYTDAILKILYLAAAALAILFFVNIMRKQKIYSRKGSLITIVGLSLLIPLACNFSNIFDEGDLYGLTIYAFVFVLIYFIVLSEQCKSVFPVVKSIFAVGMLLIVINYIAGNNIYYLKAHNSNQKAYSLTVRILDKLEPLLPLTTSNKVTVYGSLPNEYLPADNYFKGTAEIKDGSAIGTSPYVNYDMRQTVSFSIKNFGFNLRRNHGLKVSTVRGGEERETIKEEVLNRNMPVWPADGSVAIINDVIVVNFGLSDVVFENDEQGSYFRARHWISEGHTGHTYKYSWKVFQNGEEIDSHVTDSDRLYLDIPDDSGDYKVTVTVKNETVEYEYPESSVKVNSGSK